MIVLWHVGRDLKKVLMVLLQTASEGFDADEFERKAVEIDGVKSLHHIHNWSIDGESHVLSAHLVLDAADVDVAKIKEQVRDLVDSQDFEHITLETERPGEPCPQNE